MKIIFTILFLSSISFNVIAQQSILAPQNNKQKRQTALPPVPPQLKGMIANGKNGKKVIGAPQSSMIQTMQNCQKRFGNNSDAAQKCVSDQVAKNVEVNQNMFSGINDPKALMAMNCHYKSQGNNEIFNKCIQANVPTMDVEKEIKKLPIYDTEETNPSPQKPLQANNQKGNQQLIAPQKTNPQQQRKPIPLNNMLVR